MDKGTVFWVLMLVAAVFSGFGVFRPSTERWWGGGSVLLIFVLFALVGWQVFGAAVK
jgi:hypothetical protein